MRVRSPRSVAVLAALAVAAPVAAVTETANPLVEASIAAANAADQELVIVVMKDRLFLPDVVRIRSGGTVLFVWADSEARLHHSPQSSGSTGSPVLDRSGAYVPPDPAECFDSARDLGVPDVFGEGANYPLTLTFDPAADRVAKAMGLLATTPVGDVTGAQPLTLCPVGSHSRDGTIAIVPYHCRIHGKALSGMEGVMKGAIEVLPPLV